MIKTIGNLTFPFLFILKRTVKNSVHFLHNCGNRILQFQGCIIKENIFSRKQPISDSKQRLQSCLSRFRSSLNYLMIFFGRAWTSLVIFHKSTVHSPLLSSGSTFIDAFTFVDPILTAATNC